MFLDKLKELIEELDRVHPGGLVSPTAWGPSEGDGLPTFVTTETGYERFFTKKAQAALRDVVGIRYENDPGVSTVMQIAQFGNLVRKCVADLHAAGALSTNDVERSSTQLSEAVRIAISLAPQEFTHYFPCWTLGMENGRPFVVGPVTLMTSAQWANSVDFHPDMIRKYLNTPGQNARWKEDLQNILTQHNARKDADLGQQCGLTRAVFSAIRDCPSIAKVSVTGRDYSLSRKVGEIVCKAALDALSLLFGGRDYFYQQALGHERLPPLGSGSIVEMGGYLLLPGSSWGPRLRTIDYPAVRDYLAKNAEWLEALGNILDALVNPGAASHPNLAKRWSTALDWYAEGHRDRNDAVALAKIATSLDVLACVGKFRGILDMLANLLGWDEGQTVVPGRLPMTLKQVVKRIYDDGRSQILHGTEFDRLKSFEASRSHAAVLGRLALLETAIRLKRFSGDDGDKAFRDMPA